jgi:YD repeat-containing protein
MRQLILLASISLAIIACEKNEELRVADYGDLYMSSIGGGDSIRFSTYITDSTGRLTRIIDSNNRKNDLYFTDLYYDANGRIYKYTLTSNTGLSPQEFSFEYDAAGHIIKQYHVEASGQQLWNIYTYDANGRLVSGSGYQFTYDQNDNIAEFTSQSGGKMIATYSTIPNPFASFNKIQFYLVRQNPQLYYQEYLFLTKHQPTKMTYASGNSVIYDHQLINPGLIGSYYTYTGSSAQYRTQTVFYYKEVSKL